MLITPLWFPAMGVELGCAEIGGDNRATSWLAPGGAAGNGGDLATSGLLPVKAGAGKLPGTALLSKGNDGDCIPCGNGDTWV